MSVSAVSGASSAVTLSSGPSGFALSGTLSSDQLKQLANIVNNTGGTFSQGNQIDAYNILRTYFGPDHKYGALSVEDRKVVWQAAVQSDIAQRVSEQGASLNRAVSAASDDDKAQAHVNWYLSQSASDQALFFGTQVARYGNQRSPADYVASLLGQSQATDKVTLSSAALAALSPSPGNTSKADGGSLALQTLKDVLQFLKDAWANLPGGAPAPSNTD